MTDFKAADFDWEIRIFPAHIFPEMVVSIDGHKAFLDANSLTYIQVIAKTSRAAREGVRQSVKSCMADSFLSGKGPESTFRIALPDGTLSDMTLKDLVLGLFAHECFDAGILPLELTLEDDDKPQAAPSKKSPTVSLRKMKRARSEHN